MYVTENYKNVLKYIDKKRVLQLCLKCKLIYIFHPRGY